MQKHVVISTEKKKIVGLRNKLTIFFICLIISSVFWLGNNLSTEYTSNIDVAVKYHGFPKGMALSRIPESKFSVKIKASGFNLLKNRFFRKPISIDLNLEKIGSNVDKKGRNYFKTEEILDLIINQNSKDFIPLSISPDTVFFGLAQVVKREIPIRLDGDIRLNPNYIFVEQPRYSPQSIVVSGPKSILDTLKFIKTNSYLVEDLSEDKDLMTSLYFPPEYQSMLKYQKSSVKISIRIAKATEGMMEIPVKLINAPANYSLNTTPDKVKVYYKASISDYDKVRPEMFIAVADFGLMKSSENSTLVTLISKPPYVQVTRVSPQIVNFLLKKK